MLKVLIEANKFDYFLHQNSAKKILVKFFTTWCRPCQQLQANITKLLAEKNDLVVLAVDAEKFPNLVQRSEFNVQSVPALFLFSPGKKIKEKRGYLNIEELR